METISTFVLYAVCLIAASSLLVQASTEYCVVPTEQAPCLCSVTCHTLDDYLSDPMHYFKSGTTFKFMSGIHHVYKTYNGSNITGLVFIKHPSASSVTLILTNGPWFTLHNSSHISLSGINLQVNSSKSDCYSYIFKLWNVTNAGFFDVVFNSSCGGGLTFDEGKNITISHMHYYSNGKTNGISIRNTTGYTTIVHSGSQATSVYYASTSYLPCHLQNELVLSNSTFMSVDDGLIVSLSNWKGCCNVSIRDSIFESSRGNGIQVYSFSPAAQLQLDFDSDYVRNSAQIGIVLNLNTFKHLSIHNCYIENNKKGGIQLYLGHNPRSTVKLEKSIFENNWIPSNKTGVPATALAIKGQPSCDRSSSTNITMRNVLFYHNGFTSIIGEIPTVFLSQIATLQLIDCVFVDNSGTAIYSKSSTFSVDGKLNFTSNTAYEGAALYFNGESSMTLETNETEIHFVSNNASHTGGAIQVSNNAETGDPLCFLNLTNGINYRHLTFFNNTARDGGDAIYGGELTSMSSPNNCMEVVNRFSHFSNPGQNTASLITSDPSRVCLCEDNELHCLNYTESISVFPGETFHKHAFVVGQHFGTTKGTVYAQFLNKSCASTISQFQKSQSVSQHRCSSNNLSYTIQSSSPGKETLVLTAVDVTVTDIIEAASVQGAIEEYNWYNHTFIPTILLQLPVYINITIKDCPPGFSLRSGSCECNKYLQKLQKQFSVICDIQKGTIQRSKSLWISAMETGIRYSKYCLPSYCIVSSVQVNIASGEDKQCVNLRSGTLCSRCHNGSSLAIGSSRCLPQCSNRFLSLLIVFAAAGVLLILVIKYLNLTVTQGALNGIIFFANIVQTNSDIFLAPDQKSVKVLAVFIAWLNLDFGIETCFFNGLDMYSKTWLQFVFPFYIWILAGAIIVVCRYSQWATRVFGGNAVQVLATLFLLSYNKILRTVTVVYSAASIEHIDLSNHRQSTDTVWAYDGHMKYFHLQHGILFAVSTIIFMFLWIPFTFCILCGQWLQRCNHRWGLRWVGRVRPLLEAYYGPLKDTHHYWVGILLLARVVVVIPAADPFASTSANMLTVILLCLCLLFISSSFRGVYKRNYHSVLENLAFVNLAAFAALTLYMDVTNGMQDVAVYIMVGFFFVTFVVVVAAQLYIQIMKGKHKILGHNYKRMNIQGSIEDRNDEFSTSTTS